MQLSMFMHGGIHALILMSMHGGVHAFTAMSMHGGVHAFTAMSMHACTQGGGSRTLATDVVCPMYPRRQQLEALLRLMEAGQETRPMLLCEYAHSMGNSTGW